MPDTSASAHVRQHRRVYEGRVVSLDVDEGDEPGGVHGTREGGRQSGSGGAPPRAQGGRRLVRQSGGGAARRVRAGGRAVPCRNSPSPASARVGGEPDPPVRE